MIKLAHFSIKEYLMSDDLLKGAASFFHFTAEISHSLIAQTCLAYLLQFDTHIFIPSYQVFQSSPLAKYAVDNWIFHAHNGGIEKSEPSWMFRLTVKLFTPKSAQFINWVKMYEGIEGYMEHDNIASPLYYASQAGLMQVLELLVEKGVDMNAQGGYFGNALQAASYYGYEVIVKLLLEKGADVNAQGGHYSNALQAASFGGHEVIVKLLLDKGADVNTQGGEYGNALQAALSQGHEVIVKLLLEKGADVNAQGGVYGNALQAASFGGHEVIVKLLLEKGADFNAQGGGYGNALQAASSGGH